MVPAGDPHVQLSRTEQAREAQHSTQIEPLKTGCSKCPFSKAAADGSTTGVPLRYVEDDAEARTKLAGIFSSLSEVPGETAHDKSRTPRHEVRVRNAGRFITQAGIEEERGLLPFRIEEVLHEEERLEPPV